MAKKIISLSLDEEAYQKYEQICDGNGWILSKQIGNFMIKETKRNGG